jgi:hypothetical protein
MAKILGAVAKEATRFVSNTLARLSGAGLKPGADSPLTKSGEAKWGGKGSTQDFRAKLTIPAGNSQLRKDFFEDNNLLYPLRDIGGVVFPLTPSILLQHQAQYNPLASTHSNYPFYAYENSEVSSFSCIGDFPVQNIEDARAWVATLHFLRTVTKMFFGRSTNQGNPPPVLRFNAYGDHVFKNVPVIVTNFTVELTQNVDYISTKDGEYNQQGIDRNLGDGIDDDVIATKYTSWAPALSTFSIQLQPIYSRSATKNFSLQEFVKGSQNNNNSGKSNEGYGFI